MESTYVRIEEDRNRIGTRSKGIGRGTREQEIEMKRFYSSLPLNQGGSTETLDTERILKDRKTQSNVAIAPGGCKLREGENERGGIYGEKVSRKVKDTKTEKLPREAVNLCFEVLIELQ